jgi:signal transduction histidine kinase
LATQGHLSTFLIHHQYTYVDYQHPFMSTLTQPLLTEQLGFGALLQTLFDTTDTGLVQLAPVYAAGAPEALVDFTYERLNPAAQRLLGLPEHPAASFRVLAPHNTGGLAFLRDTFLSGGAGYHALAGRTAAGQPYTVRVAAQRVGPQLVASLTSETPPVANDAPRAAPARETPKEEWPLLLLEQAPVAITVLRGPHNIVELASPAMCALWFISREEVVGQPLLDVLPSFVSQEFGELLQAVPPTSTPYVMHELPAWFGQLESKEPGYFDFVYQPLYNAAGQRTGAVVVLMDISEQVRGRLCTQHLNEELRHLNEELHTTNEELHANNEALADTQQQLQRLNQELECRVARGVRDAQAAEAEAEAQRRRLARFFRQAPAAICVLDGPDLVYELVNPGYQQFFPGRELVGRPLREAAPELLTQPTYEWMRRVYETGVSHEGHEVRLRVAGPGEERPQEHYFNCVYQPRHDEQGRIDGVLVFALDVTAQVQAQQHVEALQAEAQAAAERRAQERETSYQVFEQTPAAVALMWGPEHRFEYVNPAFGALFPGRELRHRFLADIMPEPVAKGFVALLDQVYHTGETYVGTEIPFMTTLPDGQPLRQAYFNLTYQAYREEGRILGVSVFCYEVTQQVLTRQQREAHRRELEQLFMEAPMPIVILAGPEHVFQLVNSAYQRIFPGRALAGRPLLYALPELVGSPIPAICQRVYHTGELYQAQEMLVRVALYDSGPLQDRYWNFTYQPRRNEQGAVDGIWVFAHDVTEQVQTQQAVQQSAQQALDLAQSLSATNEQLRRTNVDLDNFIYTASHDLKAPIANIEGLLLLLNQQLPPNVRQAGLVPRVLTMMQGSIERFQLTIAQLTDLAKLQQAHTQPAEEVNLPELVEDVRLDLAPLLAEAHAELRINLDSCTTLSFAPQHLRSIIYNLLTNAIKYRHPARTLVVALRCHALPGATVLEVQDNGLGLTAEQQGKLFGMFRRLHNHVPGSGMGLYMVKRIVENAGGTIAVQSQPDEGSTFSVSLPH